MNFTEHAAALATVAFASTAAAQSIAPEVTFAVRDGSSFSSSSLRNALETRFRDARPVAEYALADLDGPAIQSAIISGSIVEQFSFGFGIEPASVLVEIFAGNGAADLTDFDTPAAAVGTISGLIEDFDSRAFSFDVTTQLQDLVDAGATHAALRFRAVESGVGQVDIGTDDDTFSLTFEVTAVPAPGAGVVATLALAGTIRRRR